MENNKKVIVEQSSRQAGKQRKRKGITRPNDLHLILCARIEKRDQKCIYSEIFYEQSRKMFNLPFSLSLFDIVVVIPLLLLIVYPICNIVVEYLLEINACKKKKFRRIIKL